MTDKVAFRPCTRADVESFVGEEWPFRVRAVTAHVGDKILAIGGIAILPGRQFAAFAHVSDEMRERYPIALHKAGIRGMRIALDLNAKSVLATADDDVPAAGRWLERLGFHPITVKGERLYQWNISSSRD